MIADFVKRTSFLPPKVIVFPFYLRSPSDRYFMKIKSPTEYTWLEHTDKEYFNQWASGSAKSCPKEYFDIELLIKLCIAIPEKEYMARLTAMVNYYDGIKKALNL